MIRSWDREGRALSALQRERNRRASLQSNDAFIAHLVDMARTAPRAQPGAALAYAHTGRVVRIDADPIVARQAISNNADKERRAQAQIASLMNQRNIAATIDAKQRQAKGDKSLFGSFKEDFLAPIVGTVERGYQQLTDPSGFEAATGQPLQHTGTLGAVQRGVEPVNRDLKAGIRVAGSVAEDAANLANVEYAQMQSHPVPGLPHFTPKAPTTPGQFPTNPRDLFPVTAESLSPDAGQGFSVQGAARERATATQRLTQGTVAGHAGTLGRWTAVQHISPDNKAYDFLSGSIDFGKAVVADPTNVVLAGAADAAKARRLFTLAEGADEGLEAAGGYRGIDRFVHGPTVEEHLASKRWANDRLELARDDDFLSIWEKSKGKFGAQTTAELTAAKTVEEVDDIARGVLGISTREVPKLRSGWHEIVDLPRWASVVPGRTVHIDDTDNLVENVDNFMKNLRMPRDMRSARMMQVAQAGGDHGATFEAIYRGVLEDARAHLINEYKVPPEVAKEITTAIAGESQAVGKWEAKIIADKMQAPMIQIGDELIPVTGPLSLSEMANAVHFPDPGAIRRHASIFYRLANNVPEVTIAGKKVLGPFGEMEARGVMYGAKGADAFNSLFKPLALITRLAFPIRVQSELQIRGTIAGLDTSLNHPAGAFAWAMANSKGAKNYNEYWDLLDKGLTEAEAIAQLGLEKSPNTWKNFIQNKIGRGGNTLEGEAFEASGIAHDPFNDGMDPIRGALSNEGGVFNPQAMDRVHFDRRGLFQNTDPLYGHATANEIGKWSTDPIYREVGRALQDRAVSSAEVVDWFFEGKGRKFLEEYARSDMATWGPMLHDRAVAENFLHDIVADRIIRATGGDAELVGAIASGRFRGKPIYNEHGTAHPTFMSYLDGEWKTSKHAPTVIYGDMSVRDVAAKQTLANAPKNMYKKVTGAVFDWMASRPENFMIRHPTVRQFYFARAKELAPWADEETLAKWVDEANKANMPRRYITDLAGTKRSSVGTVPGEMLDKEAKIWAGAKTNDLLWSAQSRLQFFDMARFFFPFGDAWGEVVKSWVKLTAQNPRVLRRAQQVVQGAQGAGFFYTSPETGEQVFKVPFSGWVNEHGIPGLKELPGVGGMFGGAGIPVEEEIPVQTLNPGLSGLPGFGPMAAMGVDKLIPNQPEWDTFREIMLPYGAKEVNNPLEMILPSWAAKLQAAGKLPFFKPTQQQTEQMQKNTSYAMTYLLSTGAYNQNDASSQRKLVADAQHAAELLMITRGAMQTTTPGPPNFRWKVQLNGKKVNFDKDGKVTSVDQKTGQRLMDLRIASDYYRKLQEDFDFESEATSQFLNDFGADMAMVMQPSTRSSIYGLPYGSAAYDWIRKNPDLPKAYPEIYGLFAPDGGDFDMRAYSYAQKHDEREVLTGDEFWRLSNHRIAESMYGPLREAAGPNPNDAQRKILAEFRAQLSADFVDWDVPSIQSSKPFLDGSEGAEQFVNQFRAAIADPRLAATGAALAISDYLGVRDAVREKYGGNTWSTATKKGAPYREVLRTLGAALVEEHPEFGPAWDQVFSREGLMDDEGTEE